MLQDVSTILTKYQFKSVIADDRNAGDLDGKPGVFVVASEVSSPTPGEFRFEMLHADQSENMLDAAIKALQDWRGKHEGKLFLLVAQIPESRLRLDAVRAIRERCKLDK